MEDTASLYNIEYKYYDMFTDQGEDVELILELAKRFDGPILELMSGTGRVALPLAREGFEVTTVDVHPRMLECARKNLLDESSEVQKRINIVEADIRDFKMKRKFGFIFIAYNSFLHLLQGFDQVLALRCIKDHLADNGKLFIDVFQPDLEQQQEMLNFQNSLDVLDPSGDRVVKYFSHTYDPESKRVNLTYHYDIFSQGDCKYVEVPFELRYMECGDFYELFERTGFTILDVFGDHKLNPLKIDSPRMIYVLSKEGARP